MAKRVISIEIGKNITRAVEMDFQVKKPKIYSCFSFETPAGVLDDGLIRPDENFYNILKGAMKQFCVRTKDVVFTLNSGRILSCEVKIPLVKKSKIPGILMDNVRKYFSVDLTDYQILHYITDKVNTKEDKHYRVCVLAVPNAVINSYELLAQDCNLKIAALDYAGNSIGQFVNKTVQEECSVVVKVDEELSVITIMNHGKVDLQRTVLHGVGTAVETMMASNVYGDRLSYMEALRVMGRCSAIRRHFDVEEGYWEDEDINPTITNTRIAITETLRLLIGGLKHILDDYISEHPAVRIQQIKLAGFGAQCNGLSILMSNELGYKVVALEEFTGINFCKGVDASEFKAAEYVACMGAALAPMNFQLGEDAGSKAMEAESLVMASLVYLMCAIASAFMIGYTMYRSNALENQRQQYYQQVTQLYPAKQTYDAYEAAKEELARCQEIDKLTDTQIQKVWTFIDEMEMNMPPDLVIETLSIDGQGIAMNVSVSTKEALAEALIRLRSFEYVEAVSCDGANQNTDESGNTTVKAVVTCTFTDAGIK